MRSLRQIKSRVAPANPALGITDATGAPTAPRKAAAIAAANGTAQQLISQWDLSSRTQRVDLLARFVSRHKYSTAAEMEQALGAAALLFFTRIMTWMRLTYQLGFELSVQLSALSLFLQGQRFLSTFAEVGGIEMVTDILCHIGTERADDRRNALVLLIHLANSGRVYRELVCDCNGVDHIVQAAMGEKDLKTLEFFTSLFLALGQGNPRKASLVHAGLLDLTRYGCDEAALCGASVLRALQLAREQASATSAMSMASSNTANANGSLPSIGNGSVSSQNNGQLASQPTSASMATVPVVGVDSGSPESIDRVLNALFHLLRSDNVKLRYEGVELLSLVSRSLTMVVPVLDRCLMALDEVIGGPRTATMSGGGGDLSLPPIGKSAKAPSSEALLDTLVADPAPPVAGDLKELKAKSQLRRLQLSCGRALCTILLQPTESQRLRLYKYFESRSGHMSLIKYLYLCDPRNDTAIEEVCNAIRLLAYVPAINEGYYTIDRIVEKSRTAAYLASVVGKDLLMKVLEGPQMSREQVLVLYKALRHKHQGAAGGRANGGGLPMGPGGRGRTDSVASTVEGSGMGEASETDADEAEAGGGAFVSREQPAASEANNEEA